MSLSLILLTSNKYLPKPRFYKDNRYSTPIIQFYQAIVSYVTLTFPIMILFYVRRVHSFKYLKGFRRLIEHTFVMFLFNGERHSTVTERQ